MFVLIAAVSLSFMAVLCHGASFTPCPVLDAHMQHPFANSPCSGVGVAVRALCYCLGVGEASTLSAASARDCVLAASSSNVTCPIVTTCLRGYVRSVTALTGSRVNQSDDCRTFGSKMHVAQMTSHHVTASCASMMCGILNATDLSLRCSISSASTVCLSADIDRDALDLRGVSLVGNVTFFVMHPTLTSSFSNDDYGAGFAAAVTSDLTNVIPGLRAPALTLLTLHFTRLYAFVSFAMVDPLLNLTATLEAVQALQSRNWRPPVLAQFLSPPRNSVLSTVASAAYPPAHRCGACGPTALRSAFCACLSSNRTSLSACISAVVGSRVAAKACAATLAQLPPQQVSSWCGCGLRRRLNLTEVLKSPAGNPIRTSKHHCNTARDAQHCGSTKGCFWDAVGSLCRKAVTTQPTHSARGNSVAPDMSNAVRVTCAALVVASVIGVALHRASRRRKVTDPQLKPIVNPQRKLDVSL